jgi:outer membrane protein assembly factor BamE (lipoprotein component of BamABCDE complex)
MNNYSKIFSILALLTITNCVPIDQLHGIDHLKDKSESLLPNETNVNDVVMLIGSPQNIDVTNKNVWIYNEVRTTISKLGEKQVTINDTLRLEFDNLGVLRKKDLLNKDLLSKNNFDQEKTTSLTQKQDFMTDFLSSVRKRVADFGKSTEQQ